MPKKVARLQLADPAATRGHDSLVAAVNFLASRLGSIGVTEDNILVATGTAMTFTAAYGAGSYVWSIAQNGTGGSIVAGTGEYTAGGTPGSDVIRCKDADGTEAFVKVSALKKPPLVISPDVASRRYVNLIVTALKGMGVLG